MAGFLKKTFKVLFLVALAIVAIPSGMLYSLLETLWDVLVSAFRAIWGAVYAFFRNVSKVVSVCSSKLLRRLLIDPSGIPFGTHSVSAVLGANQREKTLTGIGLWLSDLLDSIESNHCKKASERAGI